jgi:hypothetical protein
VYRGSKFILLGESDPPGSYTQIANVTSTGFNLSGTFVDTTNTGKFRWVQKVSVNRKRASVSLAGPFTGAVAMMMNRARLGGAYNYRLQEESLSYWYGAFIAESFGLSGDLGKAETYTLKLTSTGAIKRFIYVAPDVDDGPFRITDDDFVRATDDGADRIYEEPPIPDTVLLTDDAEPFITDLSEYILWS